AHKIEARGYKWKLAIYPNGNKCGNGSDHLFLYLVLVDKSSFGLNKEVVVTFNLFQFDQFRDKYLSVQGERCFHRVKTWGFDQFISLKIFNDPSCGYLIKDICVFGAEVFFIKSTERGECVSMTENPIAVKHAWKIDNFSNIKCLRYHSEEITSGTRIGKYCSSQKVIHQMVIFLCFWFGLILKLLMGLKFLWILNCAW
ncbi:hypothetical protein GIB67_033968, partial [Kingdonia uniflora]